MAGKFFGKVFDFIGLEESTLDEEEYGYDDGYNDGYDDYADDYDDGYDNSRSRSDYYEDDGYEDDYEDDYASSGKKSGRLPVSYTHLLDPGERPGLWKADAGTGDRGSKPQRKGPEDLWV